MPFRYRKLGYLALNVSSLDSTSDFAQHIIGLDPAGEGAQGERFFRCSSDHHDIVLHQSREPGIKRAAWEMESDADVLAAFDHFQRCGLNPKWLEDEDEKRNLGLFVSAPVFRLREPHSGLVFEYYSQIEQTIRPFTASLAKIERLGHFAFTVEDVRAATEFVVENMGFLVSDYVGDHAVSLLRAFPNPLHHVLGIGQSQTGSPHLHHLNFMVSDMDDLGRAWYRMQENRIEVAFGLGRHPTSGSNFLYVFDPDGMTWEYSFGMELFPEQGARKARFMSARPYDFDIWGARPQPGFASRGVIEG